MARIDRRAFIGRTLAGAGALSVTALRDQILAAKTLQAATDQVELAGTGIKASRVAMGTGFNGGGRQSAQTRLGQKEFTKLIRHGFDEGLNFFDMADLYGSHPYMKDPLKEISRDKSVLLSKIWYSEGAGMEGTDRAVPSVQRFLKELGTDMLDICLIHCVIQGNWPSQLERMRDELSELKEKGVVRAVGCSCHGFEALKTAADDPWVDVIFARINNKGVAMDRPDSEEVAAVLKRARANGKAVVGMKIYGAGRLTLRQQRDESLRYVWGNDLVNAMTIGFEKTSQVNDTVEHLNSVLRS